MNDRHKKKEIEAKWQKLIAGDDAKPTAKPANNAAGAKVIRRRKGQKDTPVSSELG